MNKVSGTLDITHIISLLIHIIGLVYRWIDAVSWTKRNQVVILHCKNYNKSKSITLKK